MGCGTSVGQKSGDKDRSLKTSANNEPYTFVMSAYETGFGTVDSRRSAQKEDGGGETGTTAP